MQVLEIEVLPLQARQFAPPQPRWHIQKDHSPLSNSKRPKKQVHFFDFENVWCPFTLSRNPNA